MLRPLLSPQIPRIDGVAIAKTKMDMVAKGQRFVFKEIGSRSVFSIDGKAIDGAAFWKSFDEIQARFEFLALKSREAGEKKNAGLLEALPAHFTDAERSVFLELLARAKTENLRDFAAPVGDWMPLDLAPTLRALGEFLIWLSPELPN